VPPFQPGQAQNAFPGDGEDSACRSGLREESLIMTVANILIRELRQKKAQAKAEKEATRRYREDNMKLIVADFNKTLKDDLADFDVEVYINETQNNVNCANGDKFYLTASKIHSNIRVGMRVQVKGDLNSVEYMDVFRAQMGTLLGAKVYKEGRDYFMVGFRCPQEDVASTIRRILTRVTPNVRVH
jgi:hypothetical protein